MPPLIIPQAAQVTLSGTAAATETWANVLHVSIGTGPFGTSDADAIEARVRAYLTGRVSSRWNQWRATRITVRDIRTEGNETFVYNLTPIVGSSSGQPLPLQTAMVLTLRSATNSRRGRGRVYINGFAGNILEQNSAQFTQAAMDAETGAFATLGQNLLLDGYNLAIASRVGVQLYGVEELSCDSVPDTQRRRVRDLVALRQSVAGITGPP